MLITMIVLPRSAAPRASSPGTEPAAPARAPVSARFLRLAWAANAIAFGVGSVVNTHAPKYLLARDCGPAAFGVLAGTVFFGQTMSFALLRGHEPRRVTLLAAYGGALLAVGAFLIAPGQLGRLAAALPLGAAIGLAYQASIHSSLDRPEGRGRAAGLHEMLLGSGSSALPLAGGAIASATGSLAAPFVFAQAVLAVGLVATVALLRTSRAATSPPAAAG